MHALSLRRARAARTRFSASLDAVYAHVDETIQALPSPEDPSPNATIARMRPARPAAPAPALHKGRSAA